MEICHLWKIINGHCVPVLLDLLEIKPEEGFKFNAVDRAAGIVNLLQQHGLDFDDWLFSGNDDQYVKTLKYEEEIKKIVTSREKTTELIVFWYPNHGLELGIGDTKKCQSDIYYCGFIIIVKKIYRCLNTPQQVGIKK